jgi:hypothetical protein
MAQQKPKGIWDDIIGLIVKAARNQTKDPELVQKVLLHGSPTKGITELLPKKGSYQMPDEQVLWLMEALQKADGIPKKLNTSENMLNTLRNPRGDGVASESIYMGQMPEWKIMDEGENVRTSFRPMEVMKEITTANKSEKELLKEFHKMLRRQGIRIPKK